MGRKASATMKVTMFYGSIAASIYVLCLSKAPYEKKEDKRDLQANLFLASRVLEGTSVGIAVKPYVAQVTL